MWWTKLPSEAPHGTTVDEKSRFPLRRDERMRRASLARCPQHGACPTVMAGPSAGEHASAYSL